MFQLINVDIEKKMDEALNYASTKLCESGHNIKPVLLHSFKLAMILYTEKYSEDIIIAGILHDLIEDTDVTATEIELIYGNKIRKIVEAVSFNPQIDDKLKQAKLMFDNCCKCGFDALIVKCADLLDNINYVNLVEDKNVKTKLLKKYEMFLRMSKNQIGNEIIYNLLKQQYDKKK